MHLTCGPRPGFEFFFGCSLLIHSAMTQVVQVLHTLRQHGVDGRGVEKCRGCVRGIAEMGIQSDL